VNEGTPAAVGEARARHRGGRAHAAAHRAAARRAAERAGRRLPGAAKNAMKNAIFGAGGSMLGGTAALMDANTNRDRWIASPRAKTLERVARAATHRRTAEMKINVGDFGYKVPDGTTGAQAGAASFVQPGAEGARGRRHEGGRGARAGRPARPADQVPRSARAPRRGRDRGEGSKARRGHDDPRARAERPRRRARPHRAGRAGRLDRRRSGAQALVRVEHEDRRRSPEDGGQGEHRARARVARGQRRHLRPLDQSGDHDAQPPDRSARA
jgi:hypothetical protein